MHIILENDDVESSSFLIIMMWQSSLKNHQKFEKEFINTNFELLKYVFK